MAEKAAAIWREKLDFFQEELAKTADPARQFELKKLIEEARTNIVELGGNPDAPRETSPARPPRLPKAPRCFGREREVEALVAALCAEPPPPTPLLGGPGVGKSTISLKALDDVRVVGRFGPRRYFVRCEAAETGEAMTRELARAVGLDLQVGGDLVERVFRELERSPAAMVLDNLETPWWAHPEPIEDLLAQLAGVPGLALAASLRGGKRPVRIEWGETVEVDVLPPEAARQTFVAIAKRHQVGDPELDGLLEAVDRVALAVELLAHQAEDEPSLASLRRRWEELRTEMLRIKGGEKRTANFGASLELSVQSVRNPGAKRLLALLGVLPDGIADSDVAALVDDVDAAAALRRVGLLARRDESRIQVLAPVRAYASKRHPPESGHLARATAFYLELAGRGGQVGREGGAAAVARLSPELNNLEVMITREFESAEPGSAVEAAVALGELYRFTGLGGSRLLEQARQGAQYAGDLQNEARCLLSLGDIALDRSDHVEARKRYQQALPLYQWVGDLHGEATCIWSLGDTALRRSDHHEARRRYEQALPLFQRSGSLHGEANCIKCLGDIALRRFNLTDALTRYEQALRLFQQAGHLVGEANCLRGLGDIALRLSYHDEAHGRYEQALSLYQRIGVPLGEANCIRSLGDIALAHSDHDESRRRYEQALLLYLRVGDSLGEANCIRGLGNTALARSEHAEARRRYEQALPLYQRVGDLLGEANCIQSLGDIAKARSEHSEACSRYEEALPLFQRVGDLEGEAHCLLSLGEMAELPAEGRRLAEEALALNGRIPDPYSMALAHAALARLADEPAERRHHVTTARELWAAIHRPDLVAALQWEFGEDADAGELEAPSAAVEP